MESLDLATAAVCLLPDGRRYRRVELSGSLVDRLNEVLHADENPRTKCSRIPFAKVVGTSTWNDPMVLGISGCSIEGGWPTSTSDGGFRPLGDELVSDLLALPRGPWQRQR